jgi:PIN domain nuclease of toxin-antitoxin system
MSTIESIVRELEKIPEPMQLSLEDAISSTQLPGDFHKDPADRIIVAMARRYNVPLITCDNNILRYPHVKTIW